MTVLIVVSAVGLGILAGAAPSWLLTVDQPISEAVRSLDQDTVWLWITDFGGTQVSIIVSLLSAVLLWNACRAMAYTFPSVVVLGMLIDVFVKVVVDRPRPAAPLVDTTLGSFPSGHTIQAVVVYGLLPPVLWILTARRQVFWGAVLALVVAVPAVSFSRIAVGAHWPSDVLASLVIGAALLLTGEYFVGSRWASVHCGACALHRAQLKPQ